ncbi:MAG: OmcA/MtrC family decaheme c-type cytochrome, partial [Alphaproteobacteria bacterium]|nr:OmcA/MtrC family decaheme c-type cytochrome [Alphaproteobacteria bacterium]
RKIVDNDTCNACHDVLNFHGGPRTDVEYCVTCHNPSSIDGDTGNSVDFKRLVHNIHSGRDGFVIIGFGGSVHDYSDVVWTQDIRNCQTCHEEDDLDTPQASNWRLVPNRQACGTCHYDDSDPLTTDDFDIENGVHPGGFQFNDDTQCVDCHGPNGTVTNSDGRLVQIQEIHRVLSLEASANFVFEVVDVRNATAGGPPLEVDYRVLDGGGMPYDLDTAPEFIACGDGTSRLAIDIGWTTDDFHNGGAGTSNASPLGINALSAAAGCGDGSDPDGDNIFTATAPAGLPAGLTGSIAVALEGHPGTDLDGDGQIAGRGDRVAVTNAIAYFGIDGATAVPRRNAVAIEKCDDCHKQLSMHGNNRTNVPEVCTMCHNPNATDIRRRVAGSACVNELGTDDRPIDFKNMIHGLHSGQIGVCGFGNSAHDFTRVAYPGRLNNCEGCHEPGGYYPVEPGQILGTTFDANDPAIVTDDVVVSPNSSACSGCHMSDLARQHMEQNGGDFAAAKAADNSLISSSVETCTVCHGPGRLADVAEVHGVGDFDFN